MRYFDISLTLEDELEKPITADLVKTNLEKDILQFIGTEGLGKGIHIIKFDQGTKRFILCCNGQDLLIRCAIILASRFENRRCVYTIHQSSENLNCFTANSRQFEH